MMTWRPMSEAPKDGTRVLDLYHDRYMEALAERDARAGHREALWHMAVGGRCGVYFGRLYHDPMHRDDAEVIERYAIEALAELGDTRAQEILRGER